MAKILTGALVLLASKLALIGLSGCAAQNTTETALAEPIKTFTPKIAEVKPTPLPPSMPPGWITDPTSGCKVFNPNPQPNESISWTGKCKKGLATGKGILQWFQDGKEGSSYDGEFRDGKEHGHGISTWANGDRYDGEFRDDKKHGHGVYTWADGGRYDGEFRDDNKNGHGIYTMANGKRWEGEWSNDKSIESTGVWAYAQAPDANWIADPTSGCKVFNANPQPNESISWTGKCKKGFATGKGTLQRFQDGKYHSQSDGEWRDGKQTGHGVLTWVNGNRYDGEWSDGKLHGHGVITFTNGNRYDGEWRDGNKNGHGIFTWASGDRYDGEYRDGKENGHGVYTWANGERYEGGWRAHKKNGHGVYTMANGKRWEGEWSNNEKIESTGAWTYAQAPDAKKIVLELCKRQGTGSALDDLTCENSSNLVAQKHWNYAEAILALCTTYETPIARIHCYSDAENLIPTEHQSAIAQYTSECKMPNSAKNGAKQADVCFANVYKQLGAAVAVKLQQQEEAARVERQQADRQAAQSREEARDYEQEKARSDAQMRQNIQTIFTNLMLMNRR